LLAVTASFCGLLWGQDADRSRNRSVSISSRERDRVLSTLPAIRTFLTDPSDRFLIDMADLRTGHPYKGKDARRPHTGGHVYFKPPKKTTSATNVDRFPAIYAVADGVITRIDYSFRLREINVSDARRRASNTRYGIGLTFATSAGKGITMHYSIEPFTDPVDEKFYGRFIFVRVGQRVKKGDVIARMYLPADPLIHRNTHIHFNLMGGPNNTFQSPSIFDDRIVKRFHASWDQRRGTDDGIPIPPCMGYKLTPAENPFGSGAVDTL
jgi:hypothetical protein